MNDSDETVTFTFTDKLDNRMGREAEIDRAHLIDRINTLLPPYYAGTTSMNNEILSVLNKEENKKAVLDYYKNKRIDEFLQQARGLFGMLTENGES